MINEYIKQYKDMSIFEWMWHHHRNLHFKMKYHGIPMQKIPTDLYIYSNDWKYDGVKSIVDKLGNCEIKNIFAYWEAKC